MTRIPAFALLLAAFAFFATPCVSQTPQGTAFTYQGVVAKNGVAINGDTDMVFALFDAPTNGNPVGSALQFTLAHGNPVNVQNGVFDVTLDFGAIAFVTPISDQRYLQVTASGTVLTPRTPIQNAPYALQSRSAELAYSVSNASIGSAQIIASQVQQRVGGICTSGSSINAIAANGTVSCQNAGGSITGVTAGTGLTGGGTSGSVGLAVAVPLNLSGSDGGGQGLIAANDTGSGYAIYANGGGGVHAQATSAYALNAVSQSNIAVYAVSNGSGMDGIQGTGGSGGNGVHGISGYVGVLGESSDYTGVYGSGKDVGVYGSGGDIGVNGIGNTGVEGVSESESGYGVYGYNDQTSGVTYGVYGESDSPNGRAVEGSDDSGVGIYGATSIGYAGYFAGNVAVTGSLSKSGGSFKIDHPLDPANKYLYHSFVESPDMKNIYDGVATLDARGEAWVDLPEYFEALNQDFRYQLTAIGRPALSLYVADEVSGNRFHIAGGFAGQRISWQVTGTRKDAYAQAHRIQVEVTKPENERGKYLFPELFGQPDSLAIDARTHPLRPSSRVVRKPVAAQQ